MKQSLLFWFSIAVVICLIVWYHHIIQLKYNSVSLYTPESIKSSDPQVEGILNQKVVFGAEIAKTKKVIITGLLRDTEDNIPFIIKKVEAVGKLFDDYAVLIVENNSKDKTRELLLAWAKKNSKVVILGCGVNNTECSIDFAKTKTEGHGVSYDRINKMVKLRNISLDYIKHHPQLRLYDYTIMWDLDIIGTAYLDGILISIYELDKNADISGICATGVRRYAGGLFSIYYDTYAHIDEGDNFHIDRKMAHDIEKGFKHAQHPRGSELIKVKSCFSGFTIYRTSSLLPPHVRYTMTPPGDDNIECEHARLAKVLPGEMSLNPNSINMVLLNT